jgi:hypothetical protein
MRQGLQCSGRGKPVPGLEPFKLSEPMWTLFFELHTGPWPISGHIMRPDTRPIEALSQVNSSENHLAKPGASTHAPPRAVPQTWKLRFAKSMANICAFVMSPSFSGAVLRRAGTIRCRWKGASTPSVQFKLLRSTERQRPFIPLRRGGRPHYRVLSHKEPNRRSARPRQTPGACWAAWHRGRRSR